MTTHMLHPLAADYLDRLRRAGRGLPRGRLTDLESEIESHLAEAIAPEASDAQALSVLERLGDPDEIVAAEQPRPMAPVDARGTREWAAIFLLLFGGFVFGLGWIAGLILLWSSRAWTLRDKWIGTLIIPGGLATTAFTLLVVAATGAQTCTSVSGAPEHCTGGPGTAVGILLVAAAAMLVAAPFATSIYLARRAR